MTHGVLNFVIGEFVLPLFYSFNSKLGFFFLYVLAVSQLSWSDILVPCPAAKGQYQLASPSPALLRSVHLFLFSNPLAQLSLASGTIVSFSCQLGTWHFL